jgi:uncharacterized membrane protein
MSGVARLLRHSVSSPIAMRRRFPRRTLAAIEGAIKACERDHSGEIRFVVESALELHAVLKAQTPRMRALDVFSQLRVWDTEHNNGVLIYVLLADRAVEIVADRGVAGGRVPQGEWDTVCRSMESHFREGRFEDGAVACVRAVAGVLARYPAGVRGGGNELPDAPVLLR